MAQRGLSGDQGGYSDFRLRLAEPDTDALQPVLKLSAEQEHGVLFRASEKCSRGRRRFPSGPAAEIPNHGVYDRGSWSRLGLAVEGGLVVSQLLTLYITPVVYIYMESFRHMGDKLHFRRKSKPARMPVETC